MELNNDKMNNLVFLQVMSLTSAQGQITPLCQRLSKKKPDPKQKLSKKSSEKQVR